MDEWASALPPQDLCASVLPASFASNGWSCGGFAPSNSGWVVCMSRRGAHLALWESNASFIFRTSSETVSPGMTRSATTSMSSSPSTTASQSQSPSFNSSITPVASGSSPTRNNGDTATNGGLPTAVVAGIATAAAFLVVLTTVGLVLWFRPSIFRACRGKIGFALCRLPRAPPAVDTLSPFHKSQAGSNVTGVSSAPSSVNSAESRRDRVNLALTPTRHPPHPESSGIPVHRAAPFGEDPSEVA